MPDEPIIEEEVTEEQSGFVEYAVDDCTVLEPNEPDAWRVRLANGVVTGIPGDPATELTPEVLAAWKANPPTSTSVHVLTPLELLSILTPQEEAALASSTNLSVMVVRNRLLSASEIRSDDPRTAEGAQVLITAGIVTAERADEIFNL